MPIKSVIATTVCNIIVNVVSSDMSEKKFDIVSRIRFQRFKLNNKKWVDGFCKKHDGTVLTTGYFEDYFKYQKPVEHIYDYIIKQDQPHYSAQSFLNERITDCKNYILSVGYKMSIHDELIVKELYEKIYDSLNKYLSNQLNLKEKYMLSEIKQGTSSAKESINVLAQQEKDHYKDIVKILNETNKISEPDIIWNIYETLSNEIWSGKLQEVYNILPIMEEKNNDLETGIRIKLEVLSNYKSLTDDVINAWKKIENNKISDDVVRVLILHFYEEKDSLNILIATIKNDVLKKITETLVQENWDIFLRVEKEEENHITIQKYSVTDKFHGEGWLIRRIVAIYLYKQSVFNIDQVLETLFAKDKNFVDELLVVDKKEEQLISNSFGEIKNNEKEVFTEIKNVLLNNRNKYINSNKKIQILFYKTILRAMIITDCNEVIQFFDIIPEMIKKNPSISSFKVQAEIERKEAAEDYVIGYCIETGQYWLLNNYLIQFSKNPEKVATVLERCLIVLDNDISLFLLYLQAVKISKGKESACELLEEYKPLYDKYLNYWIEYVEVTPNYSEELIDEIFEKWVNRKLEEYGLHIDVEFIGLLIQHNKYKEAEQVVNKLATLKVITPEILRMKAKILLEEGYIIDALNILLEIFDAYSTDPFVVDTIIVLSLNNRRKISEEVMNAAVKIGTARLLMLVAIVHEKMCKHEEAFLLMTKALLRAEENDVDTYGNYFGLHIKSANEDIRKITCVDADTTVYLVNYTSKNEKIYCIYKDTVLPSEPYKWEDAIHIYTDTAIQMDILRKKSGMQVQLEGEEYTITDIMPVNCYLFRTCLKKLVSNGVMKQFSMDINENEMLNYDKFSEWIKENIPTSDKNQEWLENYKDLINIPVPFYKLQTFTRLTYEQLIFAFMEDDSIILRELVHSEKVSGSSYVISFAALVILFKLGVDVKYFCANDIVITQSTFQEVLDEAEDIYRTNNKEHVSTMGVVDEHIFLQVSSEEEKIKKMKDASGLRKYAEKIGKVENNTDNKSEEFKQLDMVNTFGICDYDAIVIAQSSKRVLVTGEISIMLLTQIDGSEISGIGIIDFLSKINIELEDYLDYVIQMEKFRFLITLTETSLSYLISETDNISDDDRRERIMQKWIEYLSLAENMNETYRNVFVQMLTDVFRNTYEHCGISNNPIWTNFAFFVMKYNNLKINIRFTEDGEMKETTYKTTSFPQKTLVENTD